MAWNTRKCYVFINIWGTNFPIWPVPKALDYKFYCSEIYWWSMGLMKMLTITVQEIIEGTSLEKGWCKKILYRECIFESYSSINSFLSWESHYLNSHISPLQNRHNIIFLRAFVEEYWNTKYFKNSEILYEL